MTIPDSREAVLLEREDVSTRLALFRIAAADGGPPLPSFEAGQHVRFAVPGEGGGWLPRPLSIASAPEETRWIEFCVSRSGQGADLFVERLWTLHPGESTRLGARGEGRLTLRDTVGTADRRWIVMVAAGTGIAPFASLVRSWVARGDEERLARTAVLHGASAPDDLAYGAFFREILGPIRYLPSVSRPDRAAEWTGATGRVESMLAPERIDATESALGLDPGTLVPGRAVVLVCGFPETVAAVSESLESRGFARDGGALFTEG